MLPLLAFALLGGVVLWAANSYKFRPALAGGRSGGSAPLSVRMDAHVAFAQIQREHPELIQAATAELQRLGSLEFDPSVGATLEYMGEGGRAANYGSVQAIASSIETLRRRGYLMTAGLMQRVLERMLGRS